MEITIVVRGVLGIKVTKASILSLRLAHSGGAAIRIKAL